MDNIEAIRILECMAIDLTGALMTVDKDSGKYTALMKKLDAINLAQRVLQRMS